MKCFLNVFPLRFLIQEYPSETRSSIASKRIKECKPEAWNGLKWLSLPRAGMEPRASDLPSLTCFILALEDFRSAGPLMKSPLHSPSEGPLGEKEKSRASMSPLCKWEGRLPGEDFPWRWLGWDYSSLQLFRSPFLVPLCFSSLSL